jgi:hypothetical protein
MTASATEKAGASWSPVQWAGAALLWLWVLVPFGYGLYQLLIKIPALFG